MGMPECEIQIALQPKQREFYRANAQEVLYGGAAGGGKTYAQVVDALIYAVRYPMSRQIIFRRTYPELEKSVVAECFKWFPQKPYAKYNGTHHQWRFWNGSVIDLGYLNRERDVYLYQGAEYDVVRFDEVTHFTQPMVDYLRTRIRGVTPYPRSLRMSTNPGNVGHFWVKEHYVDPAPPGTVFVNDKGKRCLFIPAKLQDNRVLMQNDPEYKKQLEGLADETQKRALLYGDWDIFEGQFFSEFDRDIHVVEPFDFLRGERGIRMYRALDYGLDMLACLWIAVLPRSWVNPNGSVIVFRELCLSDLTISSAANLILENTREEEEIHTTYAPPDVMRNRDRRTGKNQGDMFAECYLKMTESNNDRVAGWLSVKELLKIQDGGRPILKIFSTCRTLIKSLPQLQHDPKRPGDCMKDPHEITHAPDALRYFANQWYRAGNVPQEAERTVAYPHDMLEDYIHGSPAVRAALVKQMGGKPKMGGL